MLPRTEMLCNGSESNMGSPLFQVGLVHLFGVCRTTACCLAEALCERREIQRRSIYCTGLIGLSRSSSRTFQNDQTDRID